MKASLAIFAVLIGSPAVVHLRPMEGRLPQSYAQTNEPEEASSPSHLMEMSSPPYSLGSPGSHMDVDSNTGASPSYDRGRSQSNDWTMAEYNQYLNYQERSATPSDVDSPARSGSSRMSSVAPDSLPSEPAAFGLRAFKKIDHPPETIPSNHVMGVVQVAPEQWEKVHLPRGDLPAHLARAGTGTNEDFLFSRVIPSQRPGEIPTLQVMSQVNIYGGNNNFIGGDNYNMAGGAHPDGSEEQRPSQPQAGSPPSRVPSFAPQRNLVDPHLFKKRPLLVPLQINRGETVPLNHVLGMLTQEEIQPKFMNVYVRKEHLPVILEGVLGPPQTQDGNYQQAYEVEIWSRIIGDTAAHIRGLADIFLTDIVRLPSESALPQPTTSGPPEIDYNFYGGNTNFVGENRYAMNDGSRGGGPGSSSRSRGNIGGRQGRGRG